MCVPSVERVAVPTATKWRVGESQRASRSIAPWAMARRFRQDAEAERARLLDGDAEAGWMASVPPPRSSTAAAADVHPSGVKAARPCGERSAARSGAEAASEPAGSVRTRPASVTEAEPSGPA